MDALSPRSQQVSVQITERAIAEDSKIFKAIACIPVAGILCSFIQELSLDDQIKHSIDSDLLIQLIDVKNDYKIASIARVLINLALFVGAVALNIFTASFVEIGIVTALLLTVVAVHTYRIIKNTEAIKALHGSSSAHEILVRNSRSGAVCNIF